MSVRNLFQGWWEDWGEDTDYDAPEEQPAVPTIYAGGIHSLIRRGVYSEWEKVNPILRDHEIAYETDTDSFRVGDGMSNYLDLPTYVKKEKK